MLTAVFAIGSSDLQDINPAVAGALVAAGVTLLLALLRAFAVTITGRRDRQRGLYSEAYRAAMTWREMVYRVRRRGTDTSDERQLVDAFHELQESIDFHEGWIASESLWMGRSYCRLVRAVKDKTSSQIQDAWDEPERRAPARGTMPDDEHPDLKSERDAFLRDVRHHLSLNPLWKLAVVWRNRKWFCGDAQ